MNIQGDLVSGREGHVHLHEIVDIFLKKKTTKNQTSVLLPEPTGANALASKKLEREEAAEK